MSSEPMNLAAVVVLYEQKLKDSSSYKSLLQHSDIPVFVYDNSPQPQEVEEDKMVYRHNPSNPGVSKAYNEAIQWAGKNNSTHLLLLDSDSEFSENALEKYREAIQQHPEKIILPEVRSSGHKISPFYFKRGKSYYGDDISYGTIELGKIAGINSGTIVPIKAIQHNFNENLPLDWSDIYFFRSNRKVKAIHIPLLVQHSLSEHEKQSLESAKFRFKTYLSGISKVADTPFEKWLMIFRAKLKSVKLSLRYRTIWFFSYFLKNVL